MATPALDNKNIVTFQTAALLNVPPVPKDPVESLWHHAPALAHLQLTLTPARTLMQRAKREDLPRPLRARHVRPDTLWLDLRNHACPIRAMTISNTAAAPCISALAMARIQEITAGAPWVVFEITQAAEASRGHLVRRCHSMEACAWAAFPGQQSL